jgi:nucleoid-associated protein YgaU
MAGFPPFSVRQPRPNDLVDDPVSICGVGTGFEATFQARVRDADGAELGLATITAGGTGIWGNFHVAIPTGVPPTTRGAVEVFEFSAKDGSEIDKVVVPVVFGRALVDPYHGFAQHKVKSGETLSKIAQHWYDDRNLWRRILEANHDQIANPNVIFPGQVLRIPQ